MADGQGLPSPAASLLMSASRLHAWAKTSALRVRVGYSGDLGLTRAVTRSDIDFVDGSALVAWPEMLFPFWS